MNIYQEKSKRRINLKITPGQYYSVLYHDVFDYPLRLSELLRWQVAEDKTPADFSTGLEAKDGYLFVAGRAKNIIKRQIRERIAQKKLLQAEKAAEILALIPTITFVGVTGSLAMRNAGDEADIDLLIIAKRGTLWTSRLVGFVLLKLAGLPVRKPLDQNEKDKLCLNIWLDEANLNWKDQNLYTAHEIAQIAPIFDRGGYLRLIKKNAWVRKFWPKATKNQNAKSKKKNDNAKFNNVAIRLFRLLEPVAYKVQRWYMQKKVTIEEVEKGRAIFHPVKLSDLVLHKTSRV